MPPPPPKPLLLSALFCRSSAIIRVADVADRGLRVTLRIVAGRQLWGKAGRSSHVKPGRVLQVSSILSPMLLILWVVGIRPSPENVCAAAARVASFGRRLHSAYDGHHALLLGVVAAAMRWFRARRSSPAGADLWTRRDMCRKAFTLASLSHP